MTSLNNSTKQRSIFNILHSSLFSVIILCIFLLSGCGGSGSGSAASPNRVNPSNATIESIVLVSPNNLNQIDLVSNYPQKVLIAAIDSNGNRKLISQKDGLVFVIANPALAKINESSYLSSTAKSGSTVLTATYNKLPPLKITVNIESAVLTSITASAGESHLSSIILPESYHTQIQAEGTFSDGKTRNISAYAGLWSSSNKNVAVESDTIFGTSLLGLTAGNATITAHLDRLASSVTVNVVKGTLNKIILSPNNITIPLKPSLHMRAMGTFNYNGSTSQTTMDITHNVTWQVESSKFAIIDKVMGILTPKESGQAVVKAIAINGMSNTASLTISNLILTALSANPSSVTLDKGLVSSPITITGTYANGTPTNVTSNVMLTNSNPDVISVSRANNEITVTALKQGSATLSAELDNNKVDIPVTVNPASITKVTVEPAQLNLPVGTESQLTAVATYTDGNSQNVTAQWSSSNPNIAAVDPNTGVITAKAASTNPVTVSATYEGHSANASVTIGDAVIAATFISDTPDGSHVLDSITAHNGVPMQLYAYARYTDNTAHLLSQGDFTWTAKQGTAQFSVESTTNILTGSKAGAGQLTLHDSKDSNISDTTISVTITDALPVSLSIQPNNNVQIANGASLQLRAIEIFSDNESQDVTSQSTWNSDSPDIISVEPNTGKATANASSGSATIKATYGNLPPANVKITASAPALNSITLDIESTVLVSKTNTVHIKAWGHYSDGESLNVTQSVNWKYNHDLIQIDQNTGLITVADIKNNVDIPIDATGNNGSIISNRITVHLESLVVTSLGFVNSNSTCNKSNNSIKCSLGFYAYYNDGSFNSYFTDFKGELKQIFLKTTTKPNQIEPTSIRIVNDIYPHLEVEYSNAANITNINFVVNYKGFNPQAGFTF